MRYKIIFQMYPGHQIGESLVNDHCFHFVHGGKFLFEYSMENLLTSFKRDEIVVLCHSGIIGDSNIKKRLERYGVELKTVLPGQITRAVVDAIGSENIDVVVRVIGNNPFIDGEIIRKCLNALERDSHDYIYFVNTPIGLTPSEIIGKGAVSKLKDVPEFNRYLDISKDLNIVSYFKKSPELRKMAFDCGFLEYRHHDLSVSHPKDLILLDNFLGKPFDLKKYNGEYSAKIIMAHIEPTNFCNLDCLMCPRKTRKRFGQLSFEDFKMILEKMVFLRRINLNGDGEPFLNPELPDMLEFARKKNIMTRCITNATIALDDGLLEKLLLSLDFFNISLDGASACTFEKIRKNGDFSRVIDNIKHMSRVIEKLHLKFDEFWINFVIQKENYLEIESMVRLVSELNIPAINFKLMNTNYDRGSDKVDLKRENLKVSMQSNNYDDPEYIGEAIERAMQLGKSLGVQVFLENDNKSGFTYVECGLDKKVFISFDGYVTPCCLRTDPEVFNFGNILTESYESIFGSERYRGFIQSLLNNNPPGLCARCPAMETLLKSHSSDGTYSVQPN